MKPSRKLLRLIVSVLVLFIVVCFDTQTAEARLDGTVQGRIRVRDNRFSAIGGGPSMAPVAVSRVIVSVRSLAASGAGDLNVINPTSFAVTDSNGNFTLSWTDHSRNAFPTNLRVTVWFESSAEVGPTGTRRPSWLFRVGSVNLGGIASADQSFERSVNQTAVNLGPLTATANDETAAYLTTDEFYTRIVRWSSILSGRMAGVVVKTQVPGFNFTFGATPLADEVFVSTGTPRTNPMTLAHELGHAATWNALDLTLAPIVPPTDYVFPPGGVLPVWSATTREFSKAAFLEGLADAWAIFWNSGDANATFTRGGLTFNVENARVTNPSGQVVLNCTTVNNAHEFPFCNTAALMDLLDNDGAGSGDGVNLSVANFAQILNRFSDCVLNGCLHEVGVDALNHHDFRCNAPDASTRASIRGVWLLNGINGGPTSSCFP